MIEYENLFKVNQPFLDELKVGFDRVLASGKFILSTEVEEFERRFASYCNTQFCIGVGNGHDALVLALRSFSFREGSEVIVPSNTHIASILSILNSRLTPVLIEPDKVTCNLDPSLVERAITKRTVAIMPVHLYGKCCSMDELLFLKRKYNLQLIEDCAQAHGAKYKGKTAGTFGEFGAFSFYPTKNLGALGDGGCLLTSDPELAVRARRLRNYGSEEKDRHQEVGVNSRLDELQAAFLSVKLNHLDKLNQRRRDLAALYNRGLSEKFLKPAVHVDYYDVHHIYHIRHPKRNLLRDHLLSHNIETKVHYPTPPYRQKALQGQFDSAYPIADEIHATTISLPISTMHTDEEILKIVNLLNDL